MEDRSEQEIIYGRHPVMEALRSGRPLQRLYVIEGARLPSDLFHMARESGVPIVHTDRQRLDNLSRRANHQGVVAAVSARSFCELQELLERPLLAGQTPFFLVLDEVQDPGNFGALLRSAESAGVHGVIISSANSCGFTAAVSRASAGADQYIAVSRVPKLGPVLRQFAESGYNLIAADSNTDSDYTAIDYSGPTVLIMGAEGKGLRPSVRELCNKLVKIPMLGHVDSLNVSVAGGILMYEVVRQRLAQKKS